MCSLNWWQLLAAYMAAGILSVTLVISFLALVAITFAKKAKEKYGL